MTPTPNNEALAALHQFIRDEEIPMSDRLGSILDALASSGQAGHAVPTTADSWPIVKIRVGDGRIESAEFYTPGLPDGEHDLWPVHVIYEPDDQGEPVGKVIRNADALPLRKIGWLDVDLPEGAMLYASPTQPASAPAREGVEAHEAELQEAELQEAEIGALCYRGNTVSFMYDKARAYGDALTETWDVLKEFGHHCDGATRLKDKVREVLSTPPAPRAPSIEPAETEKQLRVLLCSVYAGALAYMDDGEAQDNRTQPFIDFMRMSPDEIAECMRKRSLAPLAASASAGVEEFPLPDGWADAHNLARNVLDKPASALSPVGERMLAQAILDIDKARRSYSASLGQVRTEGKV